MHTTDVDATTGGIDQITSQAGENVILGGVAGDVITATGGSDNIILGDNGEVHMHLATDGDIASYVSGPGGTVHCGPHSQRDGREKEPDRD